MRLGVVTSVDRWPTDGGGWDLLVVGPDAQLADVERTLPFLRPNGAAYVVRSRELRPRGQLSAAARLLDAAGLLEVGRWALLPSPDLPRRHLPFGHAGAWSWYRESLLLAATPWTRGARQLLRLSSLWPAVQQFITPGSAIMAVRPGVPGDHADGLRERTSRTAVLTTGYDRGSRTILLPFAADARWPYAVLKIATEPLLRDATREEQRRLHHLRELLPLSVSRALPRPKGLSDEPFRTVSEEEVIQGATLLQASAAWSRNPAAALEDLTAVAEWLLELHHATARPTTPDPVAAWLCEPLARLAEFGTVDTAVSELVQLAAAGLRLLPKEQLVSILQHYDVAPGNIIRSPDGLSVLDWELDRAVGRDGFGPPLVDLLYFSCYWYFLSTGRTTREAELAGLVDFFVGAGDGCWQRRLLNERLARFSTAVGLPASATWPLLIACWLERALTAHRRWRRLGEFGAPDDTGLQYLRHLAGYTEALVKRWQEEPSVDKDWGCR